MWSASASFLARNSSSQENDCREALSQKSRSAWFYCSHRLYLRPDPVSPEPGQSPIKVNGEQFGHQDVHGLSQDRIHNHQKSRQRGLLKILF